MTYQVVRVGDAVVTELDRPAPEQTQKRLITPLAFVERFTDAEAISIDLASREDTEDAAAIRRYLQKVTIARAIDLDGDNVRNGVPALEALGLITEGRANEIMNAPIQAHELP